MSSIIESSGLDIEFFFTHFYLPQNAEMIPALAVTSCFYVKVCEKAGALITKWKLKQKGKIHCSVRLKEQYVILLTLL